MAPSPRVTDASPPRVTTVKPRTPGASTPKVDSTPEPKTSSSTYSPGVYKEPVSQFHAVLGLLLTRIAPKTGMALVTDADAIGVQWDKMARTNPKVRKTLDRLIGGSGWGAMLTVYSGVGMVAVTESGILSRIPLLKQFFPKMAPPEPEQVPTDDFGNPLGFDRRSA